MRGAVLLAAAMLAVAAPAQDVICLDPGHPSEVGRGTTGRKLSEIRAVWDLALALEKRLVAKGFAVVKTKRTRDEFVANRRRAELANAANASLMVRLHCDAMAGTGFAVYAPSRPGRAADGQVGPTPEVIRASTAAAKAFEAAMRRSLGTQFPSRRVKTDLQTAVGARQGALIGSIHSRVPVVLIECAVLTNPKDEAFLLSKAGFAAMVDALEAGILAALPAPEPRPIRSRSGSSQ